MEPERNEVYERIPWETLEEKKPDRQWLMLAVAGAIDRFNPDPGRGSFRGWLFRVARNLMVNSLIRRRRGPRVVGGTDMMQLLEEEPERGCRESALFDVEHRRQMFLWAAEQIRSEFRDTTWQALWRTCVEDQSVQTTAQLLNLSPGAVYVARSRVLARLRQRIQQLGDETAARIGDAE